MRPIQTAAWLLCGLSAALSGQVEVAAAQQTAIELDVDRIRFSKEGQDLWRSSIFWNPRNRAGSRLFLEH